MVHVVVVLLVVHHLLHVVIVGHADLYGVRIGLAEIGQGVVFQIVAVLIPVQRVAVGYELNTVGMALGIANALEQLPSATSNLVSSRCDDRLLYTDVGAWYDDSRRGDVINGRNTALELQVDVQHMALTVRYDVAVHVAHLVIVLVDDSDDSLLRQVVDVRVTGHEERTGLYRSFTVDAEVPLLVGKTPIGSSRRRFLITSCNDDTNGDIT